MGELVAETYRDAAACDGAAEPGVHLEAGSGRPVSHVRRSVSTVSCVWHSTESQPCEFPVLGAENTRVAAPMASFRNE